MKDIRVNSSWDKETEVSVIKIPFGKMRKRVHLDLSPDSRYGGGTAMAYTAEQARELAAYLIEAANRADKGYL